MRLNNPYIISFSGLPMGEHVFELTVDSTFLEKFPMEEVLSIDAKLKLTLEKLNNLLTLHFDIKGNYGLVCDRCNDEFLSPFQILETMYVKFGSTEMESEEIIILDEGEHQIDISQYLYEFIALYVPMKKVHATGKCNKEVIKKLEELAVPEDLLIDPRWEALKNVKFKN